MKCLHSRISILSIIAELSLTIAVALFLFTGSRASAFDDSVCAAMSFSARDYDSSLPDIRITVWLKQHVPAESDLVWGEWITDCGEATGSPADRKRDLPMCVEVEIKNNGSVQGYLSLLVGTLKKGVSRKDASLYYGYINRDGKRQEFHRLSDLPVTGN